jgi:uncharacterized protein YbjQ (UPF0145 family)
MQRTYKEGQAMAHASGRALLKSTGDIPNSYEVIGLVYGYRLRSAEGCANQVAILDAFKEAADTLDESALAVGGDAVINIGFLQRDTATANCGYSNKPATEVYAWGTAVKLK